MEINREIVKETFRNYTDAYDSSDEKIRLKNCTYLPGRRIVRTDRQGRGNECGGHRAGMAAWYAA